MSHHFDWPQENQDVSDVYCFAGPSDDDGPRTVIGMNASPQFGDPWDPGAFYELKLDLNDDFVEDITWRFTFPGDASGTQHVQVAQLTGRDARSRTAPGKIITPPNAPVGQVLNVQNGIKIFAGKRRDSFFNDVRVPEALFGALPNGGNPQLDALSPFSNTFLNQSVRSVVMELPVGITGRKPFQFWGSSAVFDQAHNAWFQVQRAAGPVLAVIFNPKFSKTNELLNSTEPTADLAGRPAHPATDPATGVWGTVRDQVAGIVATLGTFGQGKHGQATARAYGAFVADTLLPNVLRFTPGTTALWDPWHGIRNGKGLFEESSDSFTRMVVNEDFSTGLTQTGPILDYFPYLSEPPAS